MNGTKNYIVGGLLFGVTACLTFIAVVYATEDTTNTDMVIAASSPPVKLAGNLALVAKLRSLSELQQRVVDGDRSALSQQLVVARSIAAEIKPLPDTTWQNPRDRRSLIKYVLSGGDPSALSRLVASKEIPDGELQLARGVLAYARGDKAQAAAQLDGVRHDRLDPSLAGHVALVKAVNVSQSSPRKALDLCREAALLSPGTHIEEAALRLSISLAIQTGDLAAVERSHRRHLLRFSSSPYARDIDSRVARTLVLNSNPTAFQPEAMRSKAELTSPSRRRAYYAQLADAGLRVGKAQVAIQSSRLALSAPDTTAVSDAEATATLLAIEGAALVLTADRKDGARRLDDATASAPSGEIAALISAARSLETAIRAPPAKAADMPVAIDTNKISASSRAPTAPSASQTPVSGTPLREAVLTRGKTIFAMADKLVEQADR